MKHNRVCLITPGHAASTPRLTKEAATLAAEGYQVRVVAGNYMQPLSEFDKILAKEGRWRLVTVKQPLRYQAIHQALKQRLAYALHPLIPTSLAFAAAAHHRMSRVFASAAIAEPADLYIAHCLAALPAAYSAARHHGAALGFDAEDFHLGELGEKERHRRSVRRCIEAKILPRCRHFTAAAPLIAEAYEHTYGLRPEVVLNVFPLSEMPPKLKQPAASPSLYWFSQTIGAGRGLEAAVEALALAKSKPHLFLRGFISAEYQQKLQTTAALLGIEEQVHFLPPAAPQLMVKLAGEYDAGLSLEQTEPQNRDICLTNKIFCYLSAGLPVLLTPTQAQLAIALDLGNACRVASSHCAEALAEAYDALLCNRENLNAAKEASWKLARERYNWDSEKAVFLRSVERVCEF